jgi:gliding motility-associated-like protein
MIRRILIAFIATFLLGESYAQNVNLEVVVTRLERTNYGDCGLCGDPDPVWKVSGTHNGAGAITYGPVCRSFTELNTLIWDINDYTLMNINNTNASNFTLGLEAYEKNCSNNFCTYESYNFFTCFPSVNGDSRRCQSNNLATINFRTSPPCQWNDGITSFCGDYRVHYSFRWSYNAPPTIAVQPAPLTTNCLPTPTVLVAQAANDPNGFNTGLNFQWQVSNSTACPGTGWTDIFSSNNDTFIPPILGGTRIYRVQITSNCTPLFGFNTTTSNCAQVTYNPLGAPGDPPPAIVSGICGSTVLPGSSHSLTVLQPPAVGAPAGLTGFSWTANAGSPTTGTGTVFNWTAPVATGAYTIGVTYNDNCGANLDAQSPSCVVNVGSPTCDFAYVATTGQDIISSGGPDNPYRTLGYALTQLGTRRYVRIANGTYIENNPLLLVTDLIIEGGYDVTSNLWTKTNTSGTNLDCRGAQVINNDVAHRVGFVADNADNWLLQDLNIATTNVVNTTVSNRGFSNYAILAINGSSGFQVVRCNVNSGTAATGVAGTTPGGAGGAGGGGSGGAGGGGSNTRCGGSGGSGGSGFAGNGGASGGGGAGGCNGGGCNWYGCNANGCGGGNGGVGNTGAIGTTSWAAGDRPVVPGPVAPYFIPAGQSASGSNGFGGGGGGGGGGGDIGSCCTCSCGGGGTPNGGSGGTGGGGGLPGSGGFGGGGSFGIYASGAGTSGVLVSSVVTAGAAGLGGNGAIGQAGANGNGGNGGVFHGGCDGGNGGTGGQGGRGGDGGRGRDGANGLSFAIQIAGGASITGSSTSVPNIQTLALVTENTKFCINSEIRMTKSSGVWTLPSGLNIVNDLRDAPAGAAGSSYTNSSSPILVWTTTPNSQFDLTISGTNYARYLKVQGDNRVLPTINVAPSKLVCENGTANLSATSWGTQVEYEWKIYQGTNANSPLFQATTPTASVDFTGFATGFYIVRYRVREQCCGWSRPVFDTIRITPPPVQFVVGGGGSYCPGGNGVPVTLSGSEPGVTYVLFHNGNPVDTILGVGGPLTFANQIAIGTYTVIASRFAGCDIQMFSNTTINLFPEPTQYTVTGGGAICGSGGSTSQEVFLDGSQIGVNYQLFFNGNTPVGLAIPGTGNQLSFGQLSVPGDYSVVGTFVGSGCQARMLDTVTITLVPAPISFNVIGGGFYCVGDSGRVVSLSGSEVGVNYSLYFAGNVVAGPLVGTGNPISFPVQVNPGVYTVKAVNSSLCESDMIGNVIIGILNNPTINSVTTQNPLCFGASNGVINISASTQNGSLQYSIDSGAAYVASSNFPGLGSGNYYVVVRDDSSCFTAYPANPVILAAPSDIIASVAQFANANCNGSNSGSIDITVNGGTPGYTFIWSNSSVFEDISGLAAGSYTVTITDANGCNRTLTQTITQPATALSVTVSTTNISCAGANNGTASVVPSGGTSPYTVLWSNGATSTSVTGLTAGTYTVVVTDVNNCTFNGIAVINSAPAIGLTTAVTNVLCNGGTTGAINLTVTGGTAPIGFAWSNGATTEDLSGIAAGTYTVVVTDFNNCTATTSAIITQPSLLVVSGTAFDALCAGVNNGSINLSVGGGVLPYTYSWSNGATSQDLQNLAPSTYTVTVRDANLCSATASFTIQQPNGITSSVVGTNVTCFGASNGGANLTVSGGTTPYSFLWSNFGGTEDLTNIPGGTYYVIITDANGCVKRDSVIVQEPSPLLVNRTVTNISCFNANDGSISLAVTGGTLPYTYAWSHGPTSSSVTGLAEATYTVTVTDFNSCTVVASALVVNPPAIVVSPIVTDPLCNLVNGPNAGGAINLVVGGGTPGFTFAWSNGASTQNLSGIQGGQYTVTVTDSRGCTAVSTSTVTEPDQIIYNVFTRNVTCKDDRDGFLDITAYGGTQPYSFQWSQGNLTEDVGGLSGGFYTVTITDKNGCTVSGFFEVKEPDSLRASLFKTDATCQGANSGSVGVIVTGGTKQYSYLWNNFSADSIQTNVPGGSYSVVVTDSNGCQARASIIVNGQPSVLNSTKSINNPRCGNVSDGFAGVSVTGGAQPYSYNWGTTPPQNGSIATGLNGGTYLVTITDASGCQKVDTVVLSQPQPIVISLAGSSNQQCAGSADGSITLQAVGGTPPYTYVLNGRPQSSPVFTGIGAGTYAVSVRDSKGCEEFTSFTLSPPADFSVNLLSSREVILATQEVSFTTNVISDTTVTAYVWLPSIANFDYSGCPDTTNCPNVKARPTQTTTIVVGVVNARGCVDYDTLRIEVSNDLSQFIPTAFTPNEDGLNDFFEFDILGATNLDVNIWNRWGEKVFTNPNQLNGITQSNATGAWDGMHKGKKAAFDTYTYQIVVTYFNGKTEKIAGTVIVMR